MNVEIVDMEAKVAREHWRDYRKTVHWSRRIDAEIRRTYQLIAQGRVVIRALDSIRAAGVRDDNGMPKLAIARADATVCHAWRWTDGSAAFSPERYSLRVARFDLPTGTFPRLPSATGTLSGEALVPMIPLSHRPKRALQNYCVLWEAEWRKVVASDPMLLRRIGKADLWLVLHAWELTPVEVAALSAKVSG